MIDLERGHRHHFAILGDIREAEGECQHLVAADDVGWDEEVESVHLRIGAQPCVIDLFAVGGDDALRLFVDVQHIEVGVQVADVLGDIFDGDIHDGGVAVDDRTPAVGVTEAFFAVHRGGLVLGEGQFCTEHIIIYFAAVEILGFDEHQTFFVDEL